MVGFVVPDPYARIAGTLWPLRTVVKAERSEFILSLDDGRIARPSHRVTGDRRDRIHWHETRAVLNGVFWVLGRGAQWRELPEKYPPYQTCHRRFQQWIRSGMLEEALKTLARHLHERGQLNLEEAYVDATFASAQKGASQSAPPGASSTSFPPGSSPKTMESN